MGKGGSFKQAKINIMAIIRAIKTKNYSTICNIHLKDKNLTLKAKGLLSLILSLPDNWVYTVEGLCAISVENESAITSTLKELKMFGYLKVTKKFPNATSTGRIEYLYEVYEQPIEKQGLENQGVENQGLEFQGLENRGQLNTYNKYTNNKIINNKITNNIPPNPQGETCVLEKRFAIFWDCYPKKTGKTKCFEWFKKNKPSQELLDKIVTTITAWKKSEQWKKENGAFIPNPQTWLNRGGWDDEVSISISKDEPKQYKYTDGMI